MLCGFLFFPGANCHFSWSQIRRHIPGVLLLPQSGSFETYHLLLKAGAMSFLQTREVLRFSCSTSQFLSLLPSELPAAALNVLPVFPSFPASPPISVSVPLPSSSLFVPSSSLTHPCHFPWPPQTLLCFSCHPLLTPFQINMLEAAFELKAHFISPQK